MRLIFYFIYHLSITVVFCSIFRDEHNSVTNTNELKLKQTIREIVKTWATHDVTIISHNKRPDDKVDRVCHIISTVAASQCATNYLKISNLSMYATNDHLAATSRTLIIFVYGAPLAPAMADVTKIRHHLHKVSHVKHSPKVLFVLLLNQEIIDIQEQLEYLWKIYPYVIALEIPPTFNANETMSFYVHGYKKFAPSYNRIPYNGDVSDWYIDQFQNISGAEFKLCPFNWNAIRDDPLKIELNVNAIVPVDLFPMFQVINGSDDDPLMVSEDGKVGRFSVQTLETFRQKPREASMKRTKLCIGSVMIVHLITPKWPFKERVNDILWRINEHGFREYEFSKHFKVDYETVGLEQGIDGEWRMVMALLYGYVVVLLVFIGELVVGWILKKIRIKDGNE